MARMSEYTGSGLQDAGTYPALVANFIDMGEQDTNWGLRRQAKLAFELVEPTREADKPVLVFKTIFNLSMRSPDCRELMKAITNRAELADLDFKDLIGAACMVTITHVEKEAGVFLAVDVSRYKGTEKLPRLMSAPIFFSLMPSDFDAGTLDSLPEKLRDKIRQSGTYKELMLYFATRDKPAAAIIDDDIPF